MESDDSGESSSVTAVCAGCGAEVEVRKTWRSFTHSGCSSPAGRGFQPNPHYVRSQTQKARTPPTVSESDSPPPIAYLLLVATIAVTIWRFVANWHAHGPHFAFTGLGLFFVALVIVGSAGPIVSRRVAKWSHPDPRRAQREYTIIRIIGVGIAVAALFGLWNTSSGTGGGGGGSVPPSGPSHRQACNELLSAANQQSNPQYAQGLMDEYNNYC